MPALLCAARNATDLVHVSNTGPTFPHRVRGIKRVIVRTFEKVKLYKAGALSIWLSGDNQTFSKAASEPFTLKRFIAMNMR